MGEMRGFSSISVSPREQQIFWAVSRSCSAKMWRPFFLSGYLCGQQLEPTLLKAGLELVRLPLDWRGMYCLLQRKW